MREQHNDSLFRKIILGGAGAAKYILSGGFYLAETAADYTASIGMRVIFQGHHVPTVHNIIHNIIYGPRFYGIQPVVFNILDYVANFGRGAPPPPPHDDGDSLDDINADAAAHAAAHIVLAAEALDELQDRIDDAENDNDIIHDAAAGVAAIEHLIDAEGDLLNAVGAGGNAHMAGILEEQEEDLVEELLEHANERLAELAAGDHNNDAAPLGPQPLLPNAAPPAGGFLANTLSDSYVIIAGDLQHVEEAAQALAHNAVDLVGRLTTVTACALMMHSASGHDKHL
jgi:hypothetical protein